MFFHHVWEPANLQFEAFISGATRGKWVLIQRVAGGVGHFAIQLALHAAVYDRNSLNYQFVSGM